jgi:Flp pilus assembly protein TadG
MNRKYGNRWARRGAAVVETAVIAPLMVLSMFGMMEVGYAFMIKQSVTLASREGARAGALPGSTATDVTNAVDAAMEAANLDGYTMDSNISTLSSTDLEIWVQVSIPLNRVSFTGNMLGGGSFNIVGRTTMRREGVEAESP